MSKTAVINQSHNFDSISCSNQQQTTERQKSKLRKLSARSNLYNGTSLTVCERENDQWTGKYWSSSSTPTIDAAKKLSLPLWMYFSVLLEEQKKRKKKFGQHQANNIEG
jgi:hypothetical protein